MLISVISSHTFSTESHPVCHNHTTPHTYLGILVGSWVAGIQEQGSFKWLKSSRLWMESKEARFVGKKKRKAKEWLKQTG